MGRTTIHEKNGVRLDKVVNDDGSTHWEVWKDGGQVNGNFSEYDAETEYNDLVDDRDVKEVPFTGPDPDKSENTPPINPHKPPEPPEPQ